MASSSSVVVLKVGGSILTEQHAYRRVAEYLRERVARIPAERLVVVVSAESGVTDSLLEAARAIAPEPHPRVLDLLWSTGELRSVALLVLSLHAAGVSAAGLNVHQTGLIVDEEYRAPSGARQGQPRPPRLRRSAEASRGRAVARGSLLRLRSSLAHHSVVVVPGFLARGSSDTIVSLGRGGSDLSAVLLAHGLRASRCELIKDVAGYFSADPNRCEDARHIPELNYDEALALADDGCDLVQRRAIEAAAAARVQLVIRSLNEHGTYSIVGPLAAEPTRLLTEVRTA